MSLLLEALKRAEEDSKKRKLMDAGMPMPASAHDDGPLADSSPELVLEPVPTLVGDTPAVPEAPSFAEFTLEEQVKPPEPVDASAPLPAASAPIPAPSIEVNSLDFVLPPDEEPARRVSEPVSPLLAPRKPAHPYGRYEKPAERPTFEDSNWGALVSGPVRSRRPGSEDGATSSPSPMRAVAPRKLAEATEERYGNTRSAASAPQRLEATGAGVPPPRPATTPRQALSAAGIMAGSKKRKSASPGERRRQWVLLLAVILIALPISVFLLFGETLLGTSKGFAVSSPPVLQPAVTPPVNEPVADTVATETVVAPLPPASAAEGTGVAPLPVEPAAVPSVLASAVPASTPQNRDERTTAQRRATTASSIRQRATGAPNLPAANTSVAPRMAQGTGSQRPVSQMDAAYAAYQSGNNAEAARLYREVLKADATQRDAWLGLAVIAHADNQLEPAMDAYRRVLRLEPQNATALAGVSSLGRAASEPQQESRLREMLARSPQEPDLNQALGLYLSSEQRWSEAQPLFFKAHTLAPKEPQFAYNLAVALDQMRKSTLAAQYYETALGLAQGKAAGFDEVAARNRLAALRAGR